MATPKRITKELAEANKKKQQVLRLAGYNIKVDGSWGPWQEKQYRKVISNGGRNPNLANVGVMALPVAGYGAALLLEGLGSVSLPSISASALAMSAPMALTLAGPAYGAYEFSTGRFHLLPTDDKERQERVYSSDATRVNRPIAVSFPVKTNSKLIGERYINPVLSRTRVRYLTDTASKDSTNNKPLDTTENKSTENNLNSGNLNNGLNPKKKSWRDRLFGKPKKGNNDETSSKYPILKKIGKGAGYVTGIAVASDIAGNAVRTYNEPEDLVHQWKWPMTRTVLSPLRGLGEWWYNAYAPDSVDSVGRNNPLVILLSLERANPVLLLGDTVVPTVRTDDELITTSTRSQLDSINKAWFGE